MNKGLLVDIGGTNMRYAIASNDQEDISKINKTEFDTLDFESFLRKLVVSFICVAVFQKVAFCFRKVVVFKKSCFFICLFC